MARSWTWDSGLGTQYLKPAMRPRQLQSTFSAYFQICELRIILLWLPSGDRWVDFPGPTLSIRLGPDFQEQCVMSPNGMNSAEPSETLLTPCPPQDASELCSNCTPSLKTILVANGQVQNGYQAGRWLGSYKWLWVAYYPRAWGTWTSSREGRRGTYLSVWGLNSLKL